MLSNKEEVRRVFSQQQPKAMILPSIYSYLCKNMGMGTKNLTVYQVPIVTERPL